MSSYCYDRLPPELKPAYNSLVRAFSEGQLSAVIAGNLTQEVINTLIFAVKYDHPQLYHVDFSSNPTAVGFGLSGNMELRFKPLNFTADTTNALERIKKSFDEYREKPEYQKVRAVKQFLADSVEYSFEALNSVSAGESFDHEVMTIVGALINKKAVCEGFTMAAVYLLDYLGVRVGAAAGWRRYGDNKYEGQNNHSWNVVEIDGEWYHMDITADCKIKVNKSCSIIPDCHFLLDDATMRELIKMPADYGCISKKDNYFVRSGIEFCNLADLRHYLETFHGIGNCLAFRYTGEEPKERINKMVGYLLGRRTSSKRYSILGTVNKCYYYAISD